jgi:hypothetical protein
MRAGEGRYAFTRSDAHLALCSPTASLQHEYQKQPTFRMWMRFCDIAHREPASARVPRRSGDEPRVQRYYPTDGGRGSTRACPCRGVAATSTELAYFPPSSTKSQACMPRSCGHGRGSVIKGGHAAPRDAGHLRNGWVQCASARTQHAFTRSDAHLSSCQASLQREKQLTFERVMCLCVVTHREPASARVGGRGVSHA